jgi:GTPase
MRFLDEAKIFVKAGDGGAGAVSFRLERFVPRGGPDGGDGARGGSVILEADPDLNTLIDYRYRQHVRARTGGHGMGRNRTGRSGEDVVLKVPLGTQVLAEDRETLIADLDRPGARIVIAEGGRGGQGNARFATATNQAPRHAQPGTPGEERWIWLRLKLIADIGLVGLPNAGKSTFLAAVSRARPKIGDYPFTTLTPVLGTVVIDDRSVVLADIPGLIEKAHEGAGLGDRFLGHIERCKVLIHLVDGTEEDVAGSWRTVRDELHAYGHGLVDKPEVLCLNKVDALDGPTRELRARELEQAAGRQVHLVSGVAREGTDEVLREAFRHVAREDAS